MKFKLEIDMGNVAFEDHPDELYTLIQLMAIVVKDYKPVIGDSGPLFDTNGNRYLPEVEANARLIAAAPELLEACKLALRDSKELAPYMVTLAKAIAKAEGR